MVLCYNLFNSLGQAVEKTPATSRRNGDSIFTPSTFFHNAFERTMSLNPLMQQLFNSMNFLAPISTSYNKPHVNVGEIYMQPLPSVMPKYHHNMHHHYYPATNYIQAQPLIQHENRIKFPDSKEQMLKNYYKNAYAHQHQYRAPFSKPIVFEKEMLHETSNTKNPILDHRGALDNILGKNQVTFKDVKDAQNGQSSQIQQQVQLGPVAPQILQNMQSQQNPPNQVNQVTQIQQPTQNVPNQQNQQPQVHPNIPLHHHYNHQNKHNPNLVLNHHSNAHLHQIKHSHPSVPSPQPAQQSTQQSQNNLQHLVKNQIQVYPSQITATPITSLPMPVVIHQMPFIQMSQAPYTVPIQFHHMASHNNQFYVHQQQPDLGTTIRYMQPLHLGVMSNNVFVPPFQYLPNHKYSQPTANPHHGGISTFKPSNPIHNHHIQHNHHQPHSQNQQNNYIRFGNAAKNHNHTKIFTESEKHTTVKFSDLDPVFHPHTTPKAKTTSSPNQYRASSQINQQIDSPISTASSVHVSLLLCIFNKISCKIIQLLKFLYSSRKLS